MNLVKGKNQIIILIVVFLTIKLSNEKIYEDSQEDEIYKSYYGKTSNRKMTKKIIIIIIMNMISLKSQHQHLTFYTKVF